MDQIANKLKSRRGNIGSIGMLFIGVWIIIGLFGLMKLMSAANDSASAPDVPRSQYEQNAKEKANRIMDNLSKEEKDGDQAAKDKGDKNGAKQK